MEFALQSIIFGDDVTENLEEYLQMLDNTCFVAMEVGPLFLQYKNGNIEELLGVLDRNRLSICAYHCGLTDIIDPKKFVEICTQLQKLKCRNLICSGIISGGASKENYESTANLLSERTEDSNSQDIALHYHHHDWEFRKDFGGKLGIEILMDNLDPRTGFVVSTYWSKSGRYLAKDEHGRDLGMPGFKWLWNQYGSRCKIIHLKDGYPTKRRFRALGEGDADVEEAFSFFMDKELEYIVWEQDLAEDKAISECIRISSEWIMERI